MRIGIIGGTGGMGKGFALRWCRQNDILVGSRDAARAVQAASEYEALAKGAYGSVSGSISGASNEDAASQSDVLVLSIPYGNIDAVCSSLLPMAKDGCTIVSPIVPMEKTDAGFEFIPLRDGKQFAHQMVAGHAKDPSRVVSAFHVISEKKLADPAKELDYDIFVCGDDAGAVETVSGLVGQISGLRAVLLGGSRVAYLAEMATPLLLNAMVKNRLKNPGIKIA